MDGTVRIVDLDSEPFGDPNEAAVSAYLEIHGQASLDMALASGHLFDPDMRPASRLALKHSGDYSDLGAPYSLVVQVAPGAKKNGEKVQWHLSTGPVQLTLDFPALRSA